ncbi:MAG: GspH/FimT family pseudopilin, partial [Rhizobiales bacterium]|nr:GspH/FimT family pseudopilin [Rhizobacter sp.]
MRSTPPRAQRGVTLIEACVVLAVVAIVAGSAAPAMQGLIDARRLEGAATQLATDIQFIRSEAVARNEPLRLSLHDTAAGSCYVIHTGDAGQCDCAAPGLAQCSGAAQQIKTARLQAAERVRLQANVGSVLFDPLHGTSTPSGTLRVIGTNG